MPQHTTTWQNPWPQVIEASMKSNDSRGTNLEPWQHLGASRPAANDGQQVKKLLSLLRVILHPWHRLGNTSKIGLSVLALNFRPHTRKKDD
jgi:hypothetical protein